MLSLDCVCFCACVGTWLYPQPAPAGGDCLDQLTSHAASAQPAAESASNDVAESSEPAPESAATCTPSTTAGSSTAYTAAVLDAHSDAHAEPSPPASPFGLIQSGQDCSPSGGTGGAVDCICSTAGAACLCQQGSGVQAEHAQAADDSARASVAKLSGGSRGTQDGTEAVPVSGMVTDDLPEDRTSDSPDNAHAPNDSTTCATSMRQTDGTDASLVQPLGRRPSALKHTASAGRANQQAASKRYKVHQAPPLLTIHLKRFEQVTFSHSFNVVVPVQYSC